MHVNLPRDVIRGFLLVSAFFVASPPAQSTETSSPAPLPTSTPDASARYDNAHPVAQGGALLDTTIGPAYAADAFHIDWDAFCTAAPAHCRDGNPKYAGDDSRMIENTLPTSVYGSGVSDICNGALASRPEREGPCVKGVGVYYATANDPLVSVHCTNYPCGAGVSGTGGTLEGERIHIPRGAIVQHGGDGHLSVKQPSGVICQFWFAQNAHVAPIASPAIDVGAGACGGPSGRGEGDDLFLGGGYAAGDEMSRGLLRPEDIVGSRGVGSDARDPDAFYHALYGGFDNNRSGHVWPANSDDGQCKARETINGSMPVEGMVLYLDRAGFERVRRWDPPVYLRWLKRALGSVHRHGMLDMDSSGCTTQREKLYTNTLEWGSQSYVLGGGVSPLDAYLAHDIHPYDARFTGSPGGSEKAIYVAEPSAAYAFDVLWYRDVPGLTAANFHWIAPGCAELAVRGSTKTPC